jgi:hypothetical protein
MRFWDRTAYADDGERITSKVLIGPLAPGSMSHEVEFRDLEIVLADDQHGARYELLATDRADVLGDPVAEGALNPGRNPPIWDRARGSYVGLRIYNAGQNERWAFESARISAFQGSRRRIRR